MRRLLFLMIPLMVISVVFAQEMDLGTATQILDKGVKAYNVEKFDESKAEFENAVTAFEELLSGVLSPSDEAYSKYFLGTSQYYVGRIGKDSDMLEKSAETFREAAMAFKNLNILGEEYIRSLYIRALCSFRMAQLTTSERTRARFLENAIGDFISFLEDDNVKANADDVQELIDNGYFLLGFSRFSLGFISTFKEATYSNAIKLFGDAKEAFDVVKKSSNERLALASTYMDAVCIYTNARVYLRVSDDNWKKFKLSSQSKIAATEGKLQNSLDLNNKLITAAGTQKDIRDLTVLSKLVDMLTLGSIGQKDQLDKSIEQMADLRNNANIGKDVLRRIGDASLLNFLIYNGPARSATNNLGRIISTDNDAIYWFGWVHFVNSEYPAANTKLSNFLAKTGSDRSTRMLELRADAKFRQAECKFWMGVKTDNVNLLASADEIFKALENPKGQYYNYLTSDVRNLVSIRRFLINIETSLGKERDVSVFDAAMALAGISLPKDAEKYIEAGKYFLQKGIETAGDKRRISLNFAIHAFNRVLNASVSSEVKNRSRFLKGVSLVKLATVQEKDQAPGTIEQAKSVLTGCTSPYKNEANYVIGIGYFNINQYDKASPTLSSLKAKGHIRAAYTYALIQIERNNCSSAAKSLGSILKTVRDRTNYWYQKANLELSKLSCRGDASAAGALASYRDAPMTYENLVDEEAERGRKKRECLYIWQKDSKFKKNPDIDELVPDRPPETHVTIEIAIEPPGGEEEIVLDDKPELAKPVSGKKSLYKITTNRGTHDLIVKKKGFYLWDSQIKISRSERITIYLKKAVRYTSTGNISGTRKSLAVTSNGLETYVANAANNRLQRLDNQGKRKEEYKLRELKISAIGGLALDGSKVVITDPKRHQVITFKPKGTGAAMLIESEETPEEIITEEGVEIKSVKKIGDINVIAYSGEKYGSAPLWMPAGVTVFEGQYYIADAGNHRILLFEGPSFKKEFGGMQLIHPISVAVNGDYLLVADIGKGKIVRFTIAGEYVDEIELENQTQPSSVYVTPDGFIFVSDYVLNNLIKYTDKFVPISVASEDLLSPRAIAQRGEGPESTVYIANNSGLKILKGSWDNNYKP